MRLTLSFFLVGFLVSSFALDQTTKELPSVGVVDSTPIHNDGNVTGRAFTDNDDDEDDDVVQDSDFEDDDFGDLINSLRSNERDVFSVTHLHEERGEILVPCFGMWWPVGGPSYDYVGDYYGDYKRKRRRSKKQKKAARMKKKKS